MYPHTIHRLESFGFHYNKGEYMKKLLLSIIIILIMAVNLYADVYILIETESRNVLDISPRNDAVIQEGQEKVILQGIVSDYPLDGDVQDYKLINNRFILNSQKVNEKQAEIEKGIEIAEEIKKINDKVRELAYDELKKEGVTFKHIKESDFKPGDVSEK